MLMVDATSAWAGALIYIYSNTTHRYIYNLLFVFINFVGVHRRRRRRRCHHCRQFRPVIRIYEYIFIHIYIKLMMIIYVFSIPFEFVESRLLVWFAVRTMCIALHHQHHQHHSNWRRAHRNNDSNHKILVILVERKKHPSSLCNNTYRILMDDVDNFDRQHHRIYTYIMIEAREIDCAMTAMMMTMIYVCI